MSVKWKRPGFFILVALLLVLWIQPGMAQEAQTPEDGGSLTRQQFGGPNSVPGQLADDERLKESLTDVTLPQSYTDWKKNLLEKHGVDFSVDYTAAAFGATNTLNNEDTFAGGAVRFFGRWDLIGRDSGNTGTFVWKVENRHKYTDIPPNGTASQIGYVGIIAPTFSDIGTRLTNLYWKQNLNQNRVEIIAGMIDVTDWVDVYALASPWTGFSNFAFATGGASIPTPDDATLGAYLNFMVTDKFYIIGGLADSNADSTDPFNGFDTFFNDHEFFKTIEFGWVTSQDRFYFENTHITFWHADERDATVVTPISSGWGAAFSFAHSFNDKWMPFLRAGYANDGGTLLQKTVSAGLGYHWGSNNSLLGLGFNWGQPNEDTFGPGLDDQYTTELFTRLQVMKNLQITPDIQYIINPALNPEANHSWVFGLRARLVF
jgi:porin